MASSIKFKRITSIKGVGVFQNLTTSSDVPDFNRYNMVYGFNGSGKTILSRIFSSIQDEKLHELLPMESTFSIELSDGSKITNTNLLNSIKERLLVYNEDYIKDNLHWDDGKAKPIFYIGRIQADLAKSMADIEKEIKKTSNDLMHAAKEEKSIGKNFTNYKRITAKEIETSLDISRGYNALKLVTDYEDKQFGNHFILNSEEVKGIIRSIKRTSPTPKQPLINVKEIGFEKLLKKSRSTFESSVGKFVLQDLNDHDEMLKWVKGGFDYHQSNNLNTCLFCGNIIGNERIEDLQKVFDKKFEQLISEIEKGENEFKILREGLINLSNSIPSVNDISDELQTNFLHDSKLLNQTIEISKANASSILKLYDNKIKNPNAIIDISGLPKDIAVQQWDEVIIQHVTAINELITAHNKWHDDFNAEQDKERDKLKKHFLASSQKVYNKHKIDYEKANSYLINLQNQIQVLKDNESSLKRKLKEHGHAAERINQLLFGYLGHQELKLGVLEEGYEILRDNKSITGPLSEGEKRALSFCYFLSSIGAEGRKLDDLIIIVDDPISSLDTKALHYAFSLMRDKLEDSCQLIISTHNIHFMNEVKKWLRNLAKPPKLETKPTASLYFLKTEQRNANSKRISTIITLPKLIRDYESEYHYHFYLIYKTVNSNSDFPEYYYLLPNAIRKTLETFMQFKNPGSDKLQNKLYKLTKNQFKDDPSMINALNLLIQLESHADNIGDITSYSSMVIEQIHEASKSAFKLIEDVDPIHFKNMRKLCEREYDN